MMQTVRHERQEMLSRTRGLGRWVGVMLVVCMCAPTLAAQTTTKNDCHQEEISSLAVRACSVLINGPDLELAERGHLFTLRGNAWMKDDEPGAAVSDFARAIDIDPKNLLALKGRARAYTLIGEHNLSSEDWSRVIELTTEDDDAYLHRGLSELAAGKADQAVADFSKAIAINNKNINAYIGRGRAYDRLNEREKALKEFEMAVAIDPNYIPVYEARAEAADAWGETKLAIDNYLAAIKLNAFNLKVRQALQRLGVDTPPN